MTTAEPKWLGRLAVLEAHFRQIREHGGAQGVRDEGALDSALARPRQRWHYDPETSLAELAAAYAYGIASNHPFVDGNKRAALVTMVAFLDRNGQELTATNAEVVAVMLALAASELSEAEFARWIAAHSELVNPSNA